MKNKLKTIFFLVLVFCKVSNGQINYFNLYRPYQSTLCCPVNVYGLGLEINYYLLDNETAKLEIPVSLYWGLVGNLEFGVRVAGSTLSSKTQVDKGLTDIIVGAKYSIFKEDKNSTNSFPSLSTEICLTLPTGNYKKSFGTGALGVAFDLLLEKEVILRSGSFFNLFSNFGYKINSTNYDDYLVGNELFFSLGSYFSYLENYIFSFGVKGINHANSYQNSIKIENSGFNESYIFSGLSYDLDVYQRFFTSISIGIDDKSNKVVFNVGIMY